LKSATTWKTGEIIDLEGYYNEREDVAKKLFKANFVVVDPVDERRNVAAAVEEERLNEFIVAARSFMRSPDLNFFYPTKIKRYEQEKLTDTLKTRGSTLVFIKFQTTISVPDVLWGQLYKSHRSLGKMISRFEYNLIRKHVWSDEKICIFIFEIDSQFLSPIKKHLGPPISKNEHCELFLKKYVENTQTISGPRVEGRRWVVEVKRSYTDVKELLTEKMKNGGIEVGITHSLANDISRSFEILVDEEILSFYSSNTEFAIFLTEYLIGKPKWLTPY
jgi:tRNA nucleotidyltransferase (CCA-adding enzyme)